MKNHTLSVKTLFEVNSVVTFYHPIFGRIKGRVLSYEYTAKFGQTVLLSTTEAGLMPINEKFLQRLIVVAA